MTLSDQSNALSAEATEHLAVCIALGATREEVKVVRLLPQCRLCEEIREWAAREVGDDE